MRRFPAGVHFIIDPGDLRGRSLEPLIDSAIAGGITAVHMRAPAMPAAELYEYAKRVREVAAHRCALVINDRLDVALAVAADAVQLGRHSLPVRVARGVVERFGPLGGGAESHRRLLIGCSIHGVEEAIRAQRHGADYLILGTLYETASHPEAAPAGPELVRRVREVVRLPIVGIGGITFANVGDVIAAGADGVAVISAILDAPDPRAAAQQLVRSIHEAKEKRDV